MPAFIAACRPGFWPWAAVRICPRITSETSAGSVLARISAALIAAVPRSCAGTLAKPPLKEPTGVRAPEAMTTSVIGLALVKARRLYVLRAGFGKSHNAALQKESGQRRPKGAVLA